MILVSHAIIGGSLGRLFQSPLLAFFSGVLSHYAMDAIPHWEYDLKSIFRDEKTGKKGVRIGAEFFMDIFSATLDLVAGIVLTFLIFRNANEGADSYISLVAGIIGGIFPDGLQFLHLFIKDEPLATHQKFHNVVHAKLRLTRRPLVGIPLQVALVTLFVLVSKAIK